MRATGLYCLTGIATGATAAIAAAVPAHAQTTISNTATVEWQAGQRTMVRSSNRVDIRVEALTTTALSTFEFSNAPNAERLTIPETVCHGATGAAPVRLDGVFAGIPLAPASVARATRFRAGEPLVLSINAPDDNHDPLHLDTMTVTLRTPGGDAETLVLRESGVNTGAFVGMILTKTTSPAAAGGDCALSLRPA